MNADELKALAPLVGGDAVFIASKHGDNLWYKPERKGYKFNLHTNHDGMMEFPAECFDLLSRMEAKGLRPSLRKNKQMNQGELVEWFECWDTEFVIASGKTRTEAIVRLFIEVMK